MVKKVSMFAVLVIAATSLMAFDEPVRRTVVVRDGNVVFDDKDFFYDGGKRAYLGVSPTDMTPELREFFGAPKDAGVLVSSVAENGPAAKAGVRVGDVITSVNGKPVASYRDLRQAMKDNKSGDSIRVELVRSKNRQTVVATAEAREMPEFRFNLKELPPGFPLGEGVWKKHLLESPENEDLRAQIRALEKRLQELEKRLQK
ncbi:MAG TPA: PDZ domain-containing protein [Thermoanaerobaculia bacterium]|nr:PDZ domain-containing protein [Thermoanaerobaculia bacterium]